MFFHRFAWVIGKIQTMEAFRRGQTGGTMMALFVLTEADNLPAMEASLNYLSFLNDAMLEVLQDLPDFMSWILWPYMDYCIGVQCFHSSITSILLEEPLPEHSCYSYW